MPDLLSNDQSLPRRATHVVARRIGDSGVLVNLRTNEIFELNDTAMRVWELLDAVADRKALGVRLTGEFEVDANVADRAVQEIIGRFRRQGVAIA
jgi:hypothetical protein